MDFEMMFEMKERAFCAMVKQGLSLSALARKSGLSVGFVFRFMKMGEAQDVRISTIAAISEALGVDAKWLMFGESSPS